jgi:hypothetical protein
MDKKIVRLAIIRTNTEDSCPFGLNVAHGCRNVGDLINKMAPIDSLGDEASKEERDAIAKANNRLFMWHNPGQRCFFAGKLFADKPTVECNWHSNAPGITEKGILGAPFYSKVYNNIGLDGIYSYPLGYYADNNISRNMYYGLYSLMGGEQDANLVKLSSEEVPSQVLQAFDELADLQRGTPEHAMVQAQFALGGGVLSFVIEHTGDLTNRMAKRHHVEHMDAGYGYIEEKVNKVLRTLRNLYGFEREHKINMKNNAEARGISLNEQHEKAKQALDKYANAHKELPVFNQMQKAARGAAIALGEQKFWLAIQLLELLEVNLGSPEEWVAKATQYELNSDGTAKTI